MTTLLVDRAYDELRDRILTLRLAPGSPIDEESLIQELGVGRTPIREAIKRLALEDLVDVYPRRGTFVSEINITDLAQISELRILLEGHAAYRAAERATPADAEEAHELRNRVREARLHGWDVLMRVDTDVHRFVHRCARNVYLESAANRYFDLSLRIWHMARERVPHLAASVLAHTELLTAITTRKARLARQLAEAHVKEFEAEIRKVL